ncbi:hypothetical protein ACFQGT_11620 [Natrialbaceae archaeon GCM10025810]|uniref:hypothetical protein n=1 Tax=Halovalidus salilacus TaxID=3075124 RepID=UPI0036213856
MAQNSRTNETKPHTTTGRNSGLTRRSYVRSLAAVATATTAIGAAGTAAAQSGEPEVIEAAGETQTLEGGDVLENVIIDFSNGNYHTITVTGDATIRNVGFKGTHEHDQNPIVVTGDGEVLIENVYLGDGCVRPSSVSSHGQVGIFAHREFSGELTIRRCNIQNWPNNGVYASAPDKGGQGTVHIENCYGKNNYVSCFRIGSSGSTITDSIALNDGEGRYTGRPVWLWGSDVTVDGGQFQSGSYGGAIHIKGSTQATVKNTVHDGYSGSPATEENVDASGAGIDTSIPDDIPRSPEEAAGGN